jgi:hypothetical protein
MSPYVSMDHHWYSYNGGNSRFFKDNSAIGYRYSRDSYNERAAYKPTKEYFCSFSAFIFAH